MGGLTDTLSASTSVVLQPITSAIVSAGTAGASPERSCTGCKLTAAVNSTSAMSKSSLFGL